MPTCVICLNALRSPAALPCGHVFCYECLVKMVQNVQPFTQQHYCATCRTPYTIANIDSALVPMNLRPHLTPAIRKLCLDFTTAATPGTSPASECDRLRSENASLRVCCEVWRKRAAVHAAASLGLVGLARLTRDEVLKCKAEKMELETKYNALKRTHSPEVVQTK
ncbi:hypothetical protein BDW22DRAFT_1335987 [Trametopsis cervina]|nr:hypothetical protein BDW22DRAFT_1335987 [Trametopsis cervina]